MATSDDDDLDSAWDEQTEPDAVLPVPDTAVPSSKPPRDFLAEAAPSTAKSKVPILWDEPTTEDEEAKGTRVVPAKLLGELKTIARKEPAPARGATPSSRRRGRGELSANERPTTKMRAVREPAPASDAPRTPTTEKTPALGESFFSAILSAGPESSAPDTEPERDASIDVDEVDLSPEERAAIEADASAAEERSIAEAAQAELERIKVKLERGDHLGVVLEAAALLARLAGDDESMRKPAESYLARAKDLLEERYVEQLDGPKVPRVSKPAADIAALKIDHKAGFLISLIDGASTVREILDVCGMPQMEALALLYELRQLDIVVLERVPT